MTKKNKQIWVSAGFLFLMTVFGLFGSLGERSAEAYGGRKGISKKKKAEPVKQVKIKVPYTEDDTERMAHVNRWKYYQRTLEDELGQNAKKDASFLSKAAGELEILKEAYPRYLDLFDEGIALYRETAKKVKKRAVSKTEAELAADALEDYRRRLCVAIREFQSGGFFD